ncbi:MAG TPA: metallophosphoesterase [Luteimonas sp.]|nr:metallophosphoesterase [Luteimonas sp.]
MQVASTLLLSMASLGLVAALPPAASAAGPDARAPSFVVFGDSGYIPSYYELDDDEPPMRTIGEYMAIEVEEWLERNPSLEGFTPTPWTFETAMGSYFQASGMYPVAWAMDEYCRTWNCDFAVMLGDNIYPDGATLGADGISDERRFRQMLDQPFGAFGAGTPGFTIYSMLGNHDWRTSREAVYAQMRYLQQHPNFHMPALFYRVIPPGFEGQVEMFVIDTEVLLAGTTVRKDELDEEGNELDTGRLEEWDPHIKPANAAERNMVAWLEGALRDSTAKWKIVLGHHPLWSGAGSKYEKARALRALFLPVLCRHADAYFAGDDHTMEVYTDDCSGPDGLGKAIDQPVPLLVSGAAAKYRPLHPKFMAQQVANNPQMRNLWSKGTTWGFMHVSIEEDTMTVRTLTTPGDFSGRPVLEVEHSFPHRSLDPGP